MQGMNGMSNSMLSGYFNVCLAVLMPIFHFLARLSGDIVECLLFVLTSLMVLFVGVTVIDDISLCKYVASVNVLGFWLHMLDSYEDYYHLY